MSIEASLPMLLAAFAAQEALSLLKANEQQIEQLHTLLEQEGSEDDR